MTTTIDSSSRWFGFLLVLACTTTTGTSFAAAATEDRKVSVSYSDLDLSKPAGVQVLYKRITNAARQVCEPLAHRDLRHKSLWRDCYEQAVTSAIVTIDRPKLTALHRSKSGAAASGSTVASR